MSNFVPWLRSPYKIGRQQHLGEFLDYLVDIRSVASWTMDHQDGGARWTISERGEVPRTFSTAEAERLASTIADRSYIFWIPVPHRGNEAQYRETRTAIAERRRRLGQEPLIHGRVLPGERWA